MDGEDQERFRRVAVREALNALALSRADQLRFNGPGACVACDLLSDFAHAYDLSRGSMASSLSEEQAASLSEIHAAVESLDDADCVCFDDDVLDRPAWGRLRELARVALDRFGWPLVTDVDYVEVEPGVWRRPPLAP